MVAILPFHLKIHVTFSKKEWKPGDYYHVWASAALLANSLAVPNVAPWVCTAIVARSSRIYAACAMLRF